MEQIDMAESLLNPELMQNPLVNTDGTKKDGPYGLTLEDYQYWYCRTPWYRAKQAERRKTPKCSSYQHQYHRTDEYRENSRRRSQLPEVKEQTKQRTQKEENKAKRREWQRNFRTTLEYKNYRHDYDRKPSVKERRKERNKTEPKKEYMRNYQNDKYENDERWRVDRLLRNSVNQALRIYTSSGKIMVSKKYGIDYKACFEHLGPRPDKEHEWHIDHIRPCCSFDLTDPEQVKICFAPQNLRWLTDKENWEKLKEDKKLSIHKRRLI